VLPAAGIPFAAAQEREGTSVSMIRIRETFPEVNATAIGVDGRLDRESLPILKTVCLRHLKKKRKITLHLEGLSHIDKEARGFLKEIQEELTLEGLPEFLKLEIEDSKKSDLC
jgi:ABC-type transporter Mla MlaB component